MLCDDHLGCLQICDHTAGLAQPSSAIPTWLQGGSPIVCMSFPVPSPFLLYLTIHCPISLYEHASAQGFFLLIKSAFLVALLLEQNLDFFKVLRDNLDGSSFCINNDGLSQPVDHVKLGNMHQRACISCQYSDVFMHV